MIIAIILQITQFAVFAGKQRSPFCGYSSLRPPFVIAFSAFRVFAILDRNIPMGLLVLALSLVPVATNTVGILILSISMRCNILISPVFIHSGNIHLCYKPWARHILRIQSQNVSLPQFSVSQNCVHSSMIVDRRNPLDQSLVLTISHLKIILPPTK